MRLFSLKSALKDSLGTAKAEELSAAFYAAYGFTGAFGRNLCKICNLLKSLLDHKTYGRKKGQKMAALKITLANA